MVATQKRINTAQLFALIFIAGMSLKMLMLPVLLLKSSGRDGVIGLSVILVSELLCLAAAVAAIVLAPQKSFAELLRDCVGKIAANIIFILLALFFFFKLLLVSGEVRIFFSENLFEEFPWNLYALPFFGLCAVIGMGSARALGRTAQFMFPFIAAATFVMFFLIGRGIEYTELLPLGEYGAANTMADAARYAMWYGDYSVLIVFLGSVKRSRFTAGLGITAGVLASVSVLFFMLSLTASFSNLCYLIRFGQNVTGMSHYALGNVMQGRFDLVLFCVWMISIFVKAGLFAFAAVYCFRAVVPCKPAPPALGLCAVLYGISIFWHSATGLHSFMVNVLSWPALVFQLAVPVLMLTVALIGRRRARADGEKTDKGDADETEH